MPIIADQHMHSHYSFDSKASMKDMVESAILKGLKHISFTEHNDFDYPVSEQFPEGAWECNVDSYLYELLNLRSQYEGKIEIAFGLEIGMQESCVRKNLILSRAHEYDFIIGSNHLVDGIDTYDPAFYVDKDTKQAVISYYKSVLANIKRFQGFDVLGHLDYISRTLPAGEDAYNPLDYIDYVDEILDILLENEKGLEINTSALIKGKKNPNPGLVLLKRYKEKGGEIITVGSDAHTPENIGGCFNVAEDILKECGYKYYSVFKDRVPTYTKL